MLYVIRSSMTGMVKIGFSTVVERRIEQICAERGEDLEVLGVDPRVVHVRQEEMIQEMFSYLWIDREWFYPSQRLITFGRALESLEIPKHGREGDPRRYSWEYLSSCARRVLEGRAAEQFHFRRMSSIRGRDMMRADPNPLPLPLRPIADF
jgi:hypothetical protein